jgi:lysophospholipase L1-like esterase
LTGCTSTLSASFDGAASGDGAADLRGGDGGLLDGLAGDRGVADLSDGPRPDGAPQADSGPQPDGALQPDSGPQPDSGGPTSGLRILLLGDSITQGDASHQSYRYALWKRFVEAGIAVDFVGSQTQNHGGTPSFPKVLGKSFDADHEGHWGWRADQLLAQLPGWLASYDADVALLHVGSNDALQKQSTTTTVGELEAIIDALRVDNPAIAIFIAKLIPTTRAENSNVSQLNAQLEAICEKKHQAGSPVTLVDQSRGFDAAADTYDGIHPNAAGEQKMADVFFEALLSYPRPRVIVSTDIGGSDPDDFQSMVHLLVYADRFDLEGLISSPPDAGRAADIDEAIDAYAKDLAKLSGHAAFPQTATLRALVKQGATVKAPSAGFASATTGSQWIIARAKVKDPRPLYVLVWGSITDVAQALHDDPSIEAKLRVYSIGSWNTKQDPAARKYIYDNHPNLWWIESDTTFRGMYVGGTQSGDLGNSSFVTSHVAGKGALGKLFAAKKSDIKMGDTPSVLYLLYGNPAQPWLRHWGGAYPPTSHGPAYFTDDTTASLAEGSYDGAKTVNRWREDYLRDWQARMLWCVN